MRGCAWLVAMKNRVATIGFASQGKRNGAIAATEVPARRSVRGMAKVGGRVPGVRNHASRYATRSGDLNAGPTVVVETAVRVRPDRRVKMGFVRTWRAFPIATAPSAARTIVGEPAERAVTGRVAKAVSARMIVSPHAAAKNAAPTAAEDLAGRAVTARVVRVESARMTVSQAAVARNVVLTNAEGSAAVAVQMSTVHQANAYPTASAPAVRVVTVASTRTTGPNVTISMSISALLLAGGMSREGPV